MHLHVMFIVTNDFILDLNGIIEQLIIEVHIEFKRLTLWLSRDR